MGALYTGDPNTIILIGEHGRYEEAAAGAALSPGHMLVKNSTGQFIKHATAGGKLGPRYIAIEDSLQGKPITEAYASGDIVRAYSALPGDLLYVRVAAGTAAITKGAGVTGDGAGGVKPVGADVLWGYAETAVDNSLGAEDDFIKIRVA